MKIAQLLKEKFTFSMEVFPPKKDGDTQKLLETVKNLKNLNPDFISVTYGAGGSTRSLTKEIAGEIKNNLLIESMAHLTCIGNSKIEIKSILEDLRNLKIENILALRGDLPKDIEKKQALKDFHYASDLIQYIKQLDHQSSIGVAGYVEKHPEAKNLDEDIQNLKNKINMGADFIITQVFFDNDLYYRFYEKITKQNINTPILPGIFLIFNAKQIERMLELSGNLTIPKNLLNSIEKYKNNPDDLKKAGIEFAIQQSQELIQSKTISGLHYYIMNREDLIQEVFKEIQPK